MQTMKFDLMRPTIGGNERFVATMRYEYNPLFRFDFKAFKGWIEDRRPSLKGKRLVLTERGKDWHILDVKAVKVDGETIKADTWYKLVDGEVKEAED